MKLLVFLRLADQDRLALGPILLFTAIGVLVARPGWVAVVALVAAVVLLVLDRIIDTKGSSKELAEIRKLAEAAHHDAKRAKEALLAMAKTPDRRL